MDQTQLAASLAALPLTKCAYFERVGSTNDVAAEWAAQGVQPPALVAADEQSAGRGRSGRDWFTPPGSALAFSLLLPLPEGLAAEQLALLSGLGGLAVCLALETLYGLAPQIKWPNDVLLGGQKACGVLAEAHWQGERLAALILGIGINIASPSVPPAASLDFPATCVETALGRPLERLALLAAVVEQALTGLPELASPDLLAAWQSRLAYLGASVRLQGASQAPVEGELLGLAADGSLRLRLANGRQAAFQAGVIHLRPLVDSAAK